MNDFKTRLHNITRTLESTALEHQVKAPLLLAVSKKQPAEAIMALYHAGQRAFGESYVQEAIEKQQQLASLAIDWHFIGPIQSNKTKDIANHFDWVHSVDRLKIAKRLNDQRNPDLGRLNICIQVNIDGESSKSGVDPNELQTLCNQIKAMPNLMLRGLMCIPQKQTQFEAQRCAFAKLAALQTQLSNNGLEHLDTLSMGMSKDYQAAIAEGATIVRIGTALFGQRIS